LIACEAPGSICLRGNTSASSTARNRYRPLSSNTPDTKQGSGRSAAAPAGSMEAATRERTRSAREEQRRQAEANFHAAAEVLRARERGEVSPLVRVPGAGDRLGAFGWEFLLLALGLGTELERRLKIPYAALRRKLGLAR
jgi:hypothetical protein